MTVSIRRMTLGSGYKYLMQIVLGGQGRGRTADLPISVGDQPDS